MGEGRRERGRRGEESEGKGGIAASLTSFTYSHEEEYVNSTHVLLNSNHVMLIASMHVVQIVYARNVITGHVILIAGT